MRNTPPSKARGGQVRPQPVAAGDDRAAEPRSARRRRSDPHAVERHAVVDAAAAGLGHAVGRDHRAPRPPARASSSAGAAARAADQHGVERRSAASAAGPVEQPVQLGRHQRDVPRGPAAGRSPRRRPRPSNGRRWQHDRRRARPRSDRTQHLQPGDVRSAGARAATARARRAASAVARGRGAQRGGREQHALRARRSSRRSARRARRRRRSSGSSGRSAAGSRRASAVAAAAAPRAAPSSAAARAAPARSSAAGDRRRGTAGASVGVRVGRPVRPRFSRNASRPSTASSVMYASRVASPANTCCPTSPSSTRLKAYLSIRCAVGHLPLISRGPLQRDAAPARRAARPRSPRPSACICSAVYSRPRKKISRANFWPTCRAR